MPTLAEYRELETQFQAADNEVCRLAAAMEQSATAIRQYADLGHQHGQYRFGPTNCPTHEQVTDALTTLFNCRHLAQQAWGSLSDADRDGVPRPK